MENSPPSAHAGEIARIAAALIASTTAASAYQGRIVAGSQSGALLRRARELHARLEQELLAAKPEVGDRFHGLADRIGQKIEQLEMAQDAWRSP